MNINPILLHICSVQCIRQKIWFRSTFRYGHFLSNHSGLMALISNGGGDISGLTKLVPDKVKLFRLFWQCSYFRAFLSSTFTARICFPHCCSSRSVDNSADDGDVKKRGNGISADFLVSSTLRGCFSNFSRMNFATVQIKCGNVKAFRAITSTKQKYCTFLGVLVANIVQCFSKVPSRLAHSQRNERICSLSCRLQPQNKSVMHPEQLLLQRLRKTFFERLDGTPILSRDLPHLSIKSRMTLKLGKGLRCISRTVFCNQ